LIAEFRKPIIDPIKQSSQGGIDTKTVHIYSRVLRGV